MFPTQRSPRVGTRKRETDQLRDVWSGHKKLRTALLPLFDGPRVREWEQRANRRGAWTVLCGNVARIEVARGVDCTAGSKCTRETGGG